MKTFLGGAVLFVCITVFEPVQSRASFILNPTNNHYYGLTSSRANWDVAEGEAIAFGGHLAAINDAAENEFILANFFRNQDPDRILWIGLTDRSSEGTFSWMTGEPVTFTNWHHEEPNNKGVSGVAENYVAMNWHLVAAIAGNEGNLGDWNDASIEGTAPAEFCSPNAVGPTTGSSRSTRNLYPNPAVFPFSRWRRGSRPLASVRDANSTRRIAWIPTAPNAPKAALNNKLPKLMLT